MEVTLIVSPGRAGYNEVNFYFFDAEGAWILVESAEVRFTFLDFNAGSQSLVAAPLHPGHVLIQGSQMRHAGQWRIDARFTGPQTEGRSVSFQVLIP
jgi:hypothetical protein